ncbi:MAG: o-succinylbenzoate synthase [Gammaproteobacteria bacterium]|nr:o-succinylbenzoate synthase [Gammaproteobacteria bacterium]MBU1646484.1 o-succinylbenzoate synthase [Gammaproteobacteria bacterium]MBU1971027.1 o-succinylbenzoate synthase [Gammaproteobacteria bacterium]
MRIAQARVVPYCLPLKRPWIAAAATLTERRGALLHLTAEDGCAGWGDCAPLPSGGNAEAVLSSLADCCCRPASADFQKLPSEVRWAIETAEADIAAQNQGVPLARMLDADAPLDIAINAALGPLDAGAAVRAKEALGQGYAIGKLKVGIGLPDTELARLHEVIDATQGRLRLRLDANRAWTQSAAERFLAAIADLPIDAVEEPLAMPTPDKLAALQVALPYAIAIDESLLQFGTEALSALLAVRAVRRFVLKPARLGGIAATRAIAAKAQAAGIEVVLTSVVDSAIGVTAAAHLAAAISPALAHGLGTSAWLAADVATPPRIVAGRLLLPAAPGLGVAPVSGDLD